MVEQAVARAAAEAGAMAVDSREVGAEVPKGVDQKEVASMAGVKVGEKAEGEMAVGWKAELTVGVMEADVMAVVSLEAAWAGQEVDFSAESAALGAMEV
jgi:hypothetical protein